ncbi:MAG: hypothetical protein EPO52_11740 [Herbiconiux sp.]|uniref:hypothetical protein n=1 Tax=Herbiconiux sp. TaxID=1871186 RepID=UPI0011F9F9D0|nr:hypothetical protein [Herbiconiux sp.]TAJ47533.1 MAG: hypothetical protein EPO52_11740 [Herbiconiux sp.]
MNSRLRILAFALLGLLLLPLGAVTSALSAAPAQALSVTGHGTGVLWSKDHTSWLGNYLLGDGNFGYCLEAQKPVPGASAIEYVDGPGTGRYSRDDAARLSYIARTWGAPTDRLDTAAAQLATWTITGLSPHDQAYYAQRADGDAGEVLFRANTMLGIANGEGGASRGAWVDLGLNVAGSGGSVISQLRVDYLAGTRTIDPGRYSGTMTLRGATFGDGSRTMTVRNGEAQPIRPDQSGGRAAVSVDVEYRDLPFGASFVLGRNTGAGQSLLISSTTTMAVHATASSVGPNDLPFQPRVQTTASAPVAAPGASLHDELRLDVHPDSPTGGEWPVYRRPDGALAPIPVVITSVLLGPFGTRPLESATAPVGAPVVCTVERLVESGPGTVHSEPCTVSAAGYYVWMDSIDPGRTPADRGGGRIGAWQSAFGVADETTVVPAALEIRTAASDSTLDGPACVRDRLAVSGLPAGIDPLRVVSTLLGPLTSAPSAGSVPVDWQKYPVAGSVTTIVAADGEHDSPCIAVTRPGFYYFLVDSPEVPDAATQTPFIAGFSDRRVHAEESVAFAPPPSATPSASPQPQALASTGAPVGLGPVGISAAVIAIMGGLAALGLTLRSRR